MQQSGQCTARCEMRPGADGDRHRFIRLLWVLSSWVGSLGKACDTECQQEVRGLMPGDRGEGKWRLHRATRFVRQGLPLSPCRAHAGLGYTLHVVGQRAL